MWHCLYINELDFEINTIIIEIPDRHHSKSNIFGRSVVRTLDFINLVSFGHYDAVVL